MKPFHWMLFALVLLVGLSWGPAEASSGEMPTLPKTKKPARPAAAKKTAPKAVPSWIGSAKGKLRIKPGVDLTKPTLPSGKYL